jgi:putative flippase GtrA
LTSNPIKHSRLLAQLVSFGVVGLLATAVHAIVFVLCVEVARLSPLAANFAAFAVAVSVSYVGNYRWTFAARASVGSFARFLITSLIGLAINTTAVWVVSDLLRVSYLYALLAILFVAPVAVFLLSRYWAFRKAPPT